MLSACPSEKGDAHAASPFATVAAALLAGGVRGVVALGSPLHVSGARHFLSAFYETLFANGDLALATCAGRKRMFERALRVPTRGELPLADWLVPVAYQQEALDLSFADTAVRVTEQDSHPGLPREAHGDESLLASMGRNGPLLELERAMRRPPVGILVHVQ
jgi:CHAT domain